MEHFASANSDFSCQPMTILASHDRDVWRGAIDRRTVTLSVEQPARAR
jgi:hypothetical protein